MNRRANWNRRCETQTGWADCNVATRLLMKSRRVRNRSRGWAEAYIAAAQYAFPVCGKAKASSDHLSECCAHRLSALRLADGVPEEVCFHPSPCGLSTNPARSRCSTETSASRRDLHSAASHSEKRCRSAAHVPDRSTSP